MKLALALAAALFASTAPAAAEPRDEIAAANVRWTEAVAKKDLAALEAILAPEFELTGGDATRSVPRALWLANLQRMEIGAYRTEIADLRVTGDVALAIVKGSWTVTLDGEKRSDSFTLRDVWLRRAAGWQVVRRYRVE